MSFNEDVLLLKNNLSSLPINWDGRESILELQRRDYNWRQMEWMGFYFEILCHDCIAADFKIPGRKYDHVEFDSCRSINWDFKASAIKTDRHVAILNDIDATNASISEFGGHGIVMALADVNYNDEQRSFQRWHSKLKGKISDYEKDRIKRNATSRYRKTAAVLQQVLFLVLTNDNIQHLGVHAQGRNSNGSLRSPKYSIDIGRADIFEVGRVDFCNKQLK